MTVIDKPMLEDFTDREIEDEYIERFGARDEPRVSEFSTSDLIDELESRGRFQSEEAPSDEILDLIAEAARISPHAKRAYNLLRNEWPEIANLEGRQMLIDGRMGEVAA